MRCGDVRLPADSGTTCDPIYYATTMKLSTIVRSVAILSLASLLVGCASKPEPGKPNYGRWYESNMDSEDRAFFLGSFIGGR